ncbi:MAG: GFA family protein [Pseudomonadota bacterium]
MSDETKPIAGGCHCGAVRYEARGPTVLIELCHCESCRRTVGAPLMSWAAFRRDAFAITADRPTAYESSPGLARTFCGRCGTSLTLADDRFPDEIYVSIASLDDAEALPPEFHIWRAQRLSWLETADSLPRYRQFRVDGIVEDLPERS